jgi:hypothetical protein
VILVLESDVSEYGACACVNGLQGVGIEANRVWFWFRLQGRGGNVGGVIDGFSEEDEVEGTLAGHHRLCRGAVNGNWHRGGLASGSSTLVSSS